MVTLEINDGLVASAGFNGKIKCGPTRAQVSRRSLCTAAGSCPSRCWRTGSWPAAAKTVRSSSAPKEGTGKPVVLSHGDWVRSLAVLVDGRLASGGDAGKIKLWPKEGTGEPVVLSHGGGVLSLAVLADGRLASGGEEKEGGPAGDPTAAVAGETATAMRKVLRSGAISFEYTRAVQPRPKLYSPLKESTKLILARCRSYHCGNGSTALSQRPRSPRRPRG
jgi:hypothetical protein